jgi:anti-sigma B factor antagonist
VPELNALSVQTPPAPRLTASIEAIEEALLVRARGELDLGTVERLETPLGAALDDCSTVILDLAHLSFIDSCGLRVLLRASERARRLGRAFFIVRPSAQVSRVVEVTETDNLLPLVTGRASRSLTPLGPGTRRAWKAHPGPSHSSPEPPAASA